MCNLLFWVLCWVRRGGRSRHVRSHPFPFTTYRRGSSTRPPYTPRRWDCWRRVLKPPSCPGHWTSIVSAPCTCKRAMGSGNVICGTGWIRGEGWFSHVPFTRAKPVVFSGTETGYINRTTDGARRKIAMWTGSCFNLHTAGRQSTFKLRTFASKYRSDAECLIAEDFNWAWNRMGIVIILDFDSYLGMYKIYLIVKDSSLK